MQDALSLVRLAMDPKSVSDAIERLGAQTSAHEAVRAENNGRADALDKRESLLKDREHAVTERENAVSGREANVGAHGRTVEAQQVTLTANSFALEVAKREHAEALELAAHRNANAEQALGARRQELDQREQAIAAREAEHAERLTKLRELAQ
jgi:hypothetical protein